MSLLLVSESCYRPSRSWLVCFQKDSFIDTGYALNMIEYNNNTSNIAIMITIIFICLLRSPKGYPSLFKEVAFHIVHDEDILKCYIQRVATNLHFRTIILVTV